MNLHINELFKKILRSSPNSELGKCKAMIETQLDRFLANMDDYSELESNVLFNLFEGGEYLKLRHEAYAKTIDGRDAIIVGFSTLWFDLKLNNSGENNNEKNPIIYKEISNT